MSTARIALPEQAQSIVEFALVLPLFLLLMVGVMDFSRFLFTYASLANGTRELARTASISTATSAQIVDAFNQPTFILGSLTSGANAVTVTVRDAAGASLATSTCDLPLSSATCTPPSRSTPGADSVTVDTVYFFQFTPGFDELVQSVTALGLTITPVRMETVTTTSIE